MRINLIFADRFFVEEETVFFFDIDLNRIVTSPTRSCNK